jgi:hypothetical protein
MADNFYVEERERVICGDPALLGSRSHKTPPWANGCLLLPQAATFGGRTQ